MERSFTVNRGLWLCIGIGVAFDAALIHHLGWRVDVRHLAGFLAVMGGCALLSLVTCYARRDDRLFLFGNAVNQMICLGFVIEFLSYLGAWLDRPLVDASLIAADHVLGFGWRDWLHWLDAAAPWQLPLALTLAYRVFGAEIIILVCLLYTLCREAHGQRFIMAFYATGLACVVISALWPAFGGYVYHNIDPAIFKHLQPTAARPHESIMRALRAHSVAAVSFPLVGIVTFPSFHAAVALLFIYAAWPIRNLRWLFLPLNIAMIASTPADGGHYLVDVLAGLVIAAIAIALARRILPP